MTDYKTLVSTESSAEIMNPFHLDELDKKQNILIQNVDEEFMQEQVDE